MHVQMSEKDTAIGRQEREIGDLNDELDQEIESRQKGDDKCEQYKDQVSAFENFLLSRYFRTF